MKISQKLLLVFLLTAAVLVGLIYGATQYSISAGFSSYLAQSELETIDSLPALLSSEFKAAGTWEKVFNSPDVMERVLRANENSHLSGPLSLPQARGRPPGPEEGFLPPPFPPFRQELFKRIGVFDQDSNLIWGDPASRSSTVALPIMLDSKVIGRVTLAPAKDMGHDKVVMEHSFVDEQNQSLLAVSCISMLIASLAAILLSKHFVGAIDELVLGTRRLIAGDLTARIELSRSDELGQLARDLNILASTLEQHDRAHKQWITDTSHELRTPVAVLRAQVEAIQDGIQEPNARTLEVLHEEVMTLGKLINDLYDLARYDVQQFKLYKTPLDFSTALNEVVEAFSERFQKRNIRLDASSAAALRCILHADPARMKQLFANLLENSLRYTDEGGQVKISAGIEATQLAVYFDDSEPGVAEDSLINIFERFYRVESSRSRIYGGSGLGLAICKTIAEGHGGSLRAAPSALGGLRLELRLPIDVEEEEKKA